MSAANRPATRSRSVSSTSSPAGSARDGKGQKRNWEGGEGSSTSKITIDIAGMDGVVVTYTVPVDLPLQKLLKKYCEHKNIEYLAMDFLHEGKRVQVRRTADELGLVDGDQIDAFVHNHGGGGGGSVEVVTICTE